MPKGWIDNKYEELVHYGDTCHFTNNKAIKFYQEAIELDPYKHKAWHKKGKTLFLNNKWSESLDCLNKAIEIDPKDRIDWFFIAISNIMLNRFNESLNASFTLLEFIESDLKGSINDDLPTVKVTISLFITYIYWQLDKIIENKQFSLKAINFIENDMEKRYQDEDVPNLFKSLHYYFINDFEKAYSIFNKIEIETDEEKDEDEDEEEDTYYIYQIKILILIGVHRYEDAILLCNKILERDDKNERVLIDNGICLYNLNKYNEAVECFDKVIKLNPADEIALHGKANALFKQGNINEALDCLNKAIEINPRYVEALFDIAFF